LIFFLFIRWPPEVNCRGNTQFSFLEFHGLVLILCMSKLGLSCHGEIKGRDLYSPHLCCVIYTQNVE
jgi:hypothetical protein